MNVPSKLAAFGALSIAVFAAGLGVGAAVGPVDTPSPPTTHTPSVDGTPHTSADDGSSPPDPTTGPPDGLEPPPSGDGAPASGPVTTGPSHDVGDHPTHGAGS